MKLNNKFLIPFTGLKIGKHQFDFKIEGDFFTSFECDEFEDAAITVEVILDKKSTFLEFEFAFKGTVRVACDLTTEVFDLPIKGKNKLLVKFGDAYSDEDVELIIIPHTAHEIDVAQFVYESVLLSIPTKRVHPGIKDGTLKSDILEKLNELKPKVIKEQKEEGNPMWDKLRTLLTDK